MIDHERARELASISQESGLDPADGDWLDQHMAACEACRAFIAGPDTSSVPGDAPVRRTRLDRQSVRRFLRRPAFLITVGAVAVALVAGGLAWRAGQPTSGGVANESHPTPTSTVAASSADPWASLDPSASSEPLPPGTASVSAVLTALDTSGGVVPLDTGFRLASVDATPASELAARLTVQPNIAFSIKPDADDRAVLLTPSELLKPGFVYRFGLTGVGGELLDSWAFQARQPLRVVGTIPENEGTDVPVDTGIEITFDQDGVTDAASHVTVKPTTPGRFEQHERTLVFIPDHHLNPATVYSVTVTSGVTVGSTGEATDTETRFQFETTATSKLRKAVTFAFPDEVFESPTTERPVFGLWWFSEAETPKTPKTTRIEVYRLAGLTAGIEAFQALRTQPVWSRWSTAGLLDTTKLHRVVAVDARLNSTENAYFVRLPNRLPAGWYLVQHPDATRPIQAVLQVTDVAGYLAVSETRTLVWANDLKTGGPIVRAVVESNGTEIGRTDAHGLAMGTTPKSLLPDPAQACAQLCDPVITVRTADGRAIFLPAAAPNDRLGAFGDAYSYSDTDPGYWSLLHTDRTRYRPTDTVNLWGLARHRDSGKVPAEVSMQLVSVSYDDGNARPPVASLTARPGPTGAFTDSLQLADMPDGYYNIELLVDDVVVRTSSIVVGPIAKPAYRLEVTTGRHVYLAGDRIKVTVRASFYEGTPVSGVPLHIASYDPGTGDLINHNVTSDASGMAVYRTTAKAETNREGPRGDTFEVAPARAEEGEITGASRDVIIFPSSRTIDATARITKGRVRVSGSVHLVDVDRLESEVTGGRYIWELDPRGAAVRRAKVTARFVELVPIRRPMGTRYDFIEKKVVQVYEDDIVERAAGSVRVKTAANGTYTASIPATTKDHDYLVIVSVSDADGHVARLTTSASRHSYSIYQRDNVTLLPTRIAPNESATFGVGDRVDLTMRDPETKQSAGDGTRYLFFVAQRGLHDATVQSSPRFVTTFAPWAAPSMTVGAVRFNGHGYVGSLRFDAPFRASDRRLQVDLSVAAARYAPGDMATVDIRTRDASGAPTAATVILRAVDEKLFTIGAAEADDPLSELYAPVRSGVVGTYESHQNPRSRPDGGDTTGGGGDERDDFRDSLLFKTIETNANGRGSVSFRVSDDLTSWRVSASAITSKLDAGSGSVLVPVGLPFFVDASIAPEYLLADRPSIVVRTFGSAVAVGDPVTIEVTSRSLGYDSGPIRAKAFETTSVALPRLQPGTQTLTIAATTGTGVAARTDRLTRSFTVVETHLMRSRTSYVELPASGPFSGGPGLTTVVISDASAGQYLPLLNDIASGGGARLDRGLAAEIASSLLLSRFASAPADPDGGAFDARRYQRPDGGLALLPYSSSDLELSALAALVAPDQVDAGRLAGYLRNVRADAKETRERQMFALAGLAGLRDPVLPSIRAAAVDVSLTIRERLMIGLGAAALGDVATARSVAAALITEHGERLGGQARLRVGSSAADITTATALMAVLSAALGDHVAPLFWAYVEGNPATDQLEVLPAVAYVTHSLDRLPVQPASFAYSLEGTRTKIDLEAGRSFELSLTAPQLASLTVEPITGSIGVSTEWREPIRPTALKPDPDVTITRSVTPSTSIDSAALVTVDLTATFGPQAASGCHQVTELVPSGLTPVSSFTTWIDPDSEDSPPGHGYVLPYDQSGPMVFFCADPGTMPRTVQLRYYARVVTPGTYAWEPAIAESRSQEGHAALTAAGQIVIH